MKVRRKIKDSLSYAIAGIVYVLKTQRNMRVHFTVAIAVLFFSSFFNLSNFELLAVFFAIVLVILSEMVNTAIESTVDILTEEYNSKAKIAKNVAAGAVLIAALNSVVIGLVVFLNKINQFLPNIILVASQSTLHLMFILIVTFFLIGIIILALFS